MYNDDSSSYSSESEPEYMKKFCMQREGQKVGDYLNYIKRQLKNGYHHGCRLSEVCVSKDADICAERWLVEGILDPIHENLSPNIQEFNNDLTLDQVVQAVQDAEWLLTMEQSENDYFGEAVGRNNEDHFQVDQNGHIIVYTDGVCNKDGQPGAKGGMGVWFGKDHDSNLSLRLDSRYRQTNNVAEIRAAIEAIVTVKFYGYSRIAIHTDSKFLYNAMTDYIYNWLGNSWKGVNDKPIVTKNDFRELLSVMEDMDVEWIYQNANELPESSPHLLSIYGVYDLALNGADR